MAIARVEIKNNLYHALSILKQDGTQLTLGDRHNKKRRRVVLRENEVIMSQIKELASKNLIRVKKV